MNRYMVYYTYDSPEDVMISETEKLLRAFPEPGHYIITPFMFMIKSVEPMGKFLQKAGFAEGGRLNGFVIQVYNINGWYKTELWDWYYKD